MGNDRPWKDGPAGIRSISIHVPSWGTTDSLCGQCDQYRISIHVPSWGTTQTDITLWIYIQNFNPRSLVGNDDGVRIVGVCISNFNPRSLVGNDGVSTETDYLKSISIHVPSWGTTYLYISLYIYSHISIHVPSWGTTQTVRIRAPVKHISIHVPSWGTTFCRNRRYKKLYISIHVPSWGTTALGVTTVTTFFKYIPCFYRILHVLRVFRASCAKFPTKQ